jgi:hypothetical protein
MTLLYLFCLFIPSLCMVNTAEILALSSSALYYPLGRGREAEMHLATATSVLVGLGGGLSVSDVKGMWLGESGLVVEEEVKKLEVAVDLGGEGKSELWELAEWLAVELDQEAVLVRMGDEWMLARQPAAEFLGGRS